MVLYLGGMPRAKNGIRPQRISAPCQPQSTWRTTGTDWVGATLKLGGNFHSARTSVNSRSIAASSGDT